MRKNILLRSLAPLALAALAFGCTQKNTADEHQESWIVPRGLERFLLFPNPIVQSTGGFETDTAAYAEAYYRAIDPSDKKDTLAKWMTENGFENSSNPRSGTEHLAVFRDVRDLGYGRRMTGRRNSDDGSVAFFVENYNVTPGGSADYSSDLNVEAAIRRDTQWHVGTNAIEWSSAPCSAAELAEGCDPTVKFAKYFNFSSTDGTRQTAVDLDGKGKKAMPGPCITCHGGRGDPLTPPDAATGLPRFPLVENSLSRKRGDVQGRLQGMNVGSFGYSAQTGFTRAEQEDELRDFNQWILCTYPSATPGTPVSGSWLGSPCTRSPAGPNEWQGTAGELIEAWYGGSGMPLATFADTYVPNDWQTNNPSLYTSVVAPYCRTCHIVRGTANQSDIDFTTLAKFQGYADRIKAHVFDRGTMPLALIVYDDFWKSAAPDTLASFVDSVLGAGTAADASGAALKPGRPVADPGPNRMVRTNANATLSAENSLFASTYHWSVVSGSATIDNPDSMIAIFRATAPGACIVRLTVGNGANTNSRDVTIRVDNDFPDPLNIRFAQVKNVLQNVVHTTPQVTAQRCILCHTSPAVSPTPPVFYNNFDREGGGTVDATDDEWFLKALQANVNLTDIQASPLLRKPTGNHHRGLMSLDVTDTSGGGGLHNYSILYNWILAGMLPGGVAANAIVNGGVPLPPQTFGGTFPGPYSTTIALDGSTSVGATSYEWSLVSGPSGMVDPAAVTSAATTLTVFDVGSYVVQLTVRNGVSTDIQRRTIDVSEAPITASFTPLVGLTAVPFASNTSRGNIPLTSTSTGSPTSCRWEIVSGPGATLGTYPTIVTDQTRACNSPATLNVPFTAGTDVYQVRLTAFNAPSNKGVNVDTHDISVTNGTSVVSSIVANNGITPAVRSFTGGTPLSGIPATASVSLNGNGSSGVLPLSFAWSIISEPDSTNGAATLSSTTAAAPTLTVRATGSYTVRLQVTDGAANSATTDSTFSVTPTNGTTFATMTANFVSYGCTGCHFFNAALNNDPDPGTNNTGTTTNLFRPSLENVNDSLGKTLWRRVFQRVFPGNTARSLIILNPRDANDSGFPSDNPVGAGYATPHGGGCQMNFGCGLGDSSRLTVFQNWVLDGGPPGN